MKTFEERIKEFDVKRLELEKEYDIALYAGIQVSESGVVPILKAKDIAHNELPEVPEGTDK